MDTWHTLLGRPWQYERDAIYKYKDNVYIFIKDDKKITLAPMRKNQPKAIKVEGKSFLIIDSITKESDKPMIRKVWSNKTISPTKEFNEIIPDNLPNRLPPVRDTQHHIDLIPDTSLSEIWHYLMGIYENEILKGQVEELNWKSLIRESMFCSNNISISESFVMDGSKKPRLDMRHEHVQ